MGRSQVQFNRTKGRSRGGRGGRGAGGRGERGRQGDAVDDVTHQRHQSQQHSRYNQRQPSYVPDQESARQHAEIKPTQTAAAAEASFDDDLALLESAVSSQRYVTHSSKGEFPLLPEEFGTTTEEPTVLSVDHIQSALQMASALKNLSLAEQFRLPEHLVATLVVDDDDMRGDPAAAVPTTSVVQPPESGSAVSSLSFASKHRPVSTASSSTMTVATDRGASSASRRPVPTENNPARPSAAPSFITKTTTTPTTGQGSVTSTTTGGWNVSTTSVTTLSSSSSHAVREDDDPSLPTQQIRKTKNRIAIAPLGSSITSAAQPSSPTGLTTASVTSSGVTVNTSTIRRNYQQNQQHRPFHGSRSGGGSAQNKSSSSMTTPPVVVVDAEAEYYASSIADDDSILEETINRLVTTTQPRQYHVGEDDDPIMARRREGNNAATISNNATIAPATRVKSSPNDDWLDSAIWTQMSVERFGVMDKDAVFRQEEEQHQQPQLKDDIEYNINGDEEAVQLNDWLDSVI